MQHSRKRARLFGSELGYYVRVERHVYPGTGFKKDNKEHFKEHKAHLIMETTIYHTRGERASHYTTDVVNNDVEGLKPPNSNCLANGVICQIAV
jgi:hypothetical protein